MEARHQSCYLTLTEDVPIGRQINQQLAKGCLGARAQIEQLPNKRR